MNSIKNLKLGARTILSILLVLAICTILTLSFTMIGCKDTNEEDNANYKIHFLNVTNSDAILIESNGKFGMIDCAEDSDNPRDIPTLNLKGHEEYVVNYVKQVAGDANGKVTLDFVLGTHAHSDHLGGFDTLISDPDITVKRAYLKRYNAENIRQLELDNWDNQEVYDQMVAAIKAEEGCVLVQDNLDHMNISKDMGWSDKDLQLTIFNGMEDHTSKNIGENENSMGVLVQKFGFTAFLGGDMNNKTKRGTIGDEERVAKEIIEDFQIDHINVLKANHHGHVESNDPKYLRKLNPDIFIVPNFKKALAENAESTLTKLGADIYGALDYEGMTVQFTKDTILLFDGKGQEIKQEA